MPSVVMRIYIAHVFDNLHGAHYYDYHMISCVSLFQYGGGASLPPAYPGPPTQPPPPANPGLPYVS